MSFLPYGVTHNRLMHTDTYINHNSDTIWTQKWRTQLVATQFLFRFSFILIALFKVLDKRSVGMQRNYHTIATANQQSIVHVPRAYLYALPDTTFTGEVWLLGEDKVLQQIAFSWKILHLTSWWTRAYIPLTTCARLLCACGYACSYLTMTHMYSKLKICKAL